MTTKPREVTAEELEELAQASARSALIEWALIDSKHKASEIQIQRDFLEGAAVAAWDHYTTDSPGYQGTVYAVIWPGGPELVSTFIRHDGGIMEARKP